MRSDESGINGVGKFIIDIKELELGCMGRGRVVVWK